MLFIFLLYNYGVTKRTEKFLKPIYNSLLIPKIFHLSYCICNLNVSLSSALKLSIFPTNSFFFFFQLRGTETIRNETCGEHPRINSATRDSNFVIGITRVQNFVFRMLHRKYLSMSVSSYTLSSTWSSITRATNLLFVTESNAVTTLINFFINGDNSVELKFLLGTKSKPNEYSYRPFSLRKVFTQFPASPRSNYSPNSHFFSSGVNFFLTLQL